MKMKEVVLETIEELLDIKVSEYSLKSLFKEIGMDYLDLSELIMVLEDKLEFTANFSIYDTKTVDELIKHINKLTKI